MAYVAVGHPELRRKRLGCLMATHAVNHLRQGKVSETGAAFDIAVTGCATEAILIANLEMHGVVELDILPGSGNCLEGDFFQLWCNGRVFDLLGGVASAAISSNRIGAQEGFHPRLGVACSTLGMGWKRGVSSLGIQFVAKRTVRSRVSGGV